MPLAASSMFLAPTNLLHVTANLSTGLAVIAGCHRYIQTRSTSSSSGGDLPAGGDDISTPSTSYSLPWETEQPALPPNYASIQANIGHMDTNQLQTALGVAIAAEDYQLATRWVWGSACDWAAVCEAVARVLAPLCALCQHGTADSIVLGLGVSSQSCVWDV